MILATSCNVAGHVVIEDQVIIEGMVGIQHPAESANMLSLPVLAVRKNVPPYIKAAREPLSYIGINGIDCVEEGLTSIAFKPSKTSTGRSTS